MKPVSAEFVTSVPAGRDVPTHGLPVVALVGRSNVGKSSLINALVKNRIARSGATPGTTRLLNIYRVTPAGGTRPFILVDLPGYGYARGGTRTRQDFDALTTGFFETMTTGVARRNGHTVQLAGLLLVLDIRHPDLAPDLAALEWTMRHGFPLVAVATKCDRISRAARERGLRAHVDALGQGSTPSFPVIMVSSRTGEGIGQVWAKLKDLLQLL